MGSQERRAKESAIIQAALAILRAEGDAALTMRALAGATGMSLSNVQYYFANKDVLLTALVEEYFEACAAFIAEVVASTRTRRIQDPVRHVLEKAFEDGQEMVEMCAIFRELWAIASRNSHISKRLDEYYRQLADLLCDALFPSIENPDAVARVKLLLVPYIEGYSIAGRSLGGTPKEAAALINEMVLTIIEEE